MSPHERVNFYTDSFWTFLYSSYDILSQIINQIKALGVEEKKVSLHRVFEEISSRTNLYKEINRVFKSRNYKYIRESRNCSTHRRHIFIEELRSTTSVPAGYAATTSAIETRIYYLADNPEDMSPKTDRKKELRILIVR